jgi:uncharacterized membrane-anchored protein YjiN (DUF445 family)
VTLPDVAPERLHALRRMKFFAAGLLVAAAVFFVVARVVGHGKGVWGFLQAAAEAAMVGGLADWFAVTALFRYPLGIPIPHTAIIPRKKDQIGASLGLFVQQNFLTATVVGDRIRSAEIPRRVGDWLVDPGHARRLVEEAAAALQGTATVMSDEEIRHAVAAFAEARLREIQAAPVVARVIDIVVEGGQHQVALTAGLRGLMRFLNDNRPALRQRLADESPEWVPEWVDDRVFLKLFTGLQNYLADIVSDEDHDFRLQFDKRLRAYASSLRTDPAAIARLEAAKQQLLDHPAVGTWLSSLWFPLKKALLDAAADPSSELRTTAEGVVVRIGESLRSDPATQYKVEGWLQTAVTHLLARYGDDIAELISTTVARWDTKETSRRIELQVGRDLQFIRVNGTVVGALVGVLIYTVARLL